MKKIKLNDGQFVLVDEKDYFNLLKYKWTSVSFQTGKTFARNQKHGLLHKFLLKENPDEIFDVNFLNGNTLDCRRENLQKIDAKIQMPDIKIIKKNLQLGLFSLNSSPDEKSSKMISENSSGIIQKTVYEARYVSPEGRIFNFGTFETMEEAQQAYDKMIKMIPQ